MPPDSIAENQFSKFSWGGMPPDFPSICMLRMQCTLQLHTLLTTLTQNLPDRSKFASYTPAHVRSLHSLLSRVTGNTTTLPNSLATYI